MNASAYVMYISSNTTTGGLFLEKTVEMGFKPLLICEDIKRFPFASCPDLEVATMDEADRSTVLGFAREFARHHQVAGVLSSSDYFQVMAAEVGRLLGLPSLDPAILQFSGNKFNQRQRLAQHGIDQPRYRLATSPTEAVEAFHQLGSPAIVKPIAGSGSVGVRLVTTPDEVALAASMICGRKTNERGLTVDCRLLVEEFVEGDEYSIEVFHGRAIGVTEKRLGSKPFFVETGHAYPAPLDKSSRHRLEQIATSAVGALELSFGPAHVEAKLTNRGAAIVEVNPRLAGGFIPRIVELTGVDLVSMTIGAATGAKPLTPATGYEAAAIRFLIPARSGAIGNVAGIEEARRRSGVRDLRLYKATGESVQLQGDFRDRIGHVIAVGSSPAEAVSRADAALQSIDVSVAETKEPCCA